jgi:nuclear pore complex protein Nup62
MYDACFTLFASLLAAASLGDAATPLGKAVRILNNQLQALAQADARIEELGQRLSLADLHPN